MCQLENELSRKQATGYKIAVTKDGKYYSICTGIEYKVGKVPKLKQQEILVSDWGDLQRGSAFHKSNYNGNTAVFKKKVDCIEYKQYIS